MTLVLMQRGKVVATFALHDAHAAMRVWRLTACGHLVVFG
jgi:hypothetical protein